MRLTTVLFFVCALNAGCEDRRLIVIATIPDLADFARQIGGEYVQVESMAQGNEDPHAVPVRPALAARLARADVLIEMGLDLEHAFLPALVEASNNPRLKKEGLIVASEGSVPKEIPLVITRAEGDQHPEGNPHMNLDPGGGKRMARTIAARLSEIAPAHAEAFAANLKKMLATLRDKELEWKKKGAKLKGVKYVSFHPDLIYFADYFGMEQIGTLEPKAGIPPSAGHTAEIVERLNQIQGIKLVLREPQYSENLPREIAAATGAKAVTVAIMVNGVPEAKTWVEMIDANLNAILKALESNP